MKSIFLFIFLFLSPILAISPAKQVARNLISKYKNALEIKNRTMFFETTSENFKLFACGRANNYLTRDVIFDSISVIPNHVLIMNFINVTEAAFFRFGAMQIRTIVNGLKVNFDAQRQNDGKYVLTMEYNRDCPPFYPPLTTLSIDYYEMAAKFARDLINRFLRSIQNRILEQVQECFTQPYYIKYCDYFHNYHEMTIKNLNISMMPNVSSLPEWPVKIRNAILCRNGSLTFEVHGGAFDRYYEAVIDEDRWRINTEQRLRCTYAPKSIEFNLLQNSILQ